MSLADHYQELHVCCLIYLDKESFLYYDCCVASPIPTILGKENEILYYTMILSLTLLLPK